MRLARTSSAVLRTGFVLGLAACSSSTTPTGVDDGGANDAATAKEGGAAACSTLADSAPTVAERCDPSAGATPAGGTVADGTYYLTDSAVLNGGSSGTCPSPPLDNHVSKTIRITGSTFESAEPNSMGLSHYEASWTTSTTTITFTTVCETPQVVHLGSFSEEYTATSGQLTLFNGSSSVDTYTKQ